MRGIWDDFRKFIMRGNVLDLAVAVVIGTAFTALVHSFVDDILLQVVAVFFGKPDFSSLHITINDAQIRIGSFITAGVTFVIIAAAVFVIVEVFQKLQSMRSRTTDADTPAPSDEAVLLTEI